MSVARSVKVSLYFILILGACSPNLSRAKMVSLRVPAFLVEYTRVQVMAEKRLGFFDKELRSNGRSGEWSTLQALYGRVEQQSYECEFQISEKHFSVRCQDKKASGQSLSYFVDESHVIRLTATGLADSTSPALRLVPEEVERMAGR